MDINIQDEYYNKYIKYKTKYLELKQSEGGGFFKKMFGISTSKSKSKEEKKIIKEEEKIITEEEIYGSYYNKFKNEIYKNGIYKDPHKHFFYEWIKDIHKLLIIYILPQLYNNINNESKIDIIKIHIAFCNITNEYRKYFVNHPPLPVYHVDNLYHLKEHFIICIENIKIKTRIDLPLLRDFIGIYINYLDYIHKNAKETGIDYYNNYLCNLKIKDLDNLNDKNITPEHKILLNNFLSAINNHKNNLQFTV